MRVIAQQPVTKEETARKGELILITANLILKIEFFFAVNARIKNKTEFRNDDDRLRGRKGFA